MAGICSDKSSIELDQTAVAQGGQYPLCSESGNTDVQIARPNAAVRGPAISLESESPFHGIGPGRYRLP